MLHRKRNEISEPGMRTIVLYGSMLGWCKYVLFMFVMISVLLSWLLPYFYKTKALQIVPLWLRISSAIAGMILLLRVITAKYVTSITVYHSSIIVTCLFKTYVVVLSDITAVRIDNQGHFLIYRTNEPMLSGFVGLRRSAVIEFRNALCERHVSVI